MKSVKFRLRNGTYDDEVVVAGERVRLNEENGTFDDRRYLGLVSFRQKYFYNVRSDMELANGVSLFSRHFGKGSNFSEANPKPPCSKEDRDLLILLLRNRLEGMRGEVRIMYLTGTDSIFMRQKLDSFDRLKALIDVLEQKIRLGGTDCVGEVAAGKVELEATDAQRANIRRLLKKFAVLIIQARDGTPEYEGITEKAREIVSGVEGVDLNDERLTAFATTWMEATKKPLPDEIRRILLDTDVQQLDRGVQEELVIIRDTIWDNIRALFGQAADDPVFRSWQEKQGILTTETDLKKQIVGTLEWALTTVVGQRTEVSAKEADMNGLKGRLAEAEKAAQTSQDRINAIQNELTVEKEKAASLVEQLGEKDILVTTAQAQTAAAVQEKEAERVALQRQFEAATRESEQLRAQIQARSDEIRRAVGRVAATEAALAGAQRTIANMSLGASSREGALLKQVQENRTTISEAQGRAAGAEAALKTLEEKNKTTEESTTTQINELRGALEMQTRELEQMRPLIIQLTQEKDRLNARVSALTSEESARLRDVQAKLQRAEEQRDKTQADLEANQAALKLLQEAAKARGAEADAALRQRSVDNLTTSLRLGMTQTAVQKLKAAVKGMAEAIANGQPYRIPPGLGSDESTALAQLMDNVEKMREAQNIPAEPISPTMELCFLSYFVSYFNKLVFYGVANTPKEQQDMQQLLKTMDTFVEASSDELNRLHGVGGRSAALKILLDVTFDCLQAGEDYLLSAPDFSKAGYYFIKNDGPGNDEEWSYRNNRYNDAFYAIYKQFDEAFVTKFPETLQAMSGVIFSRLSPRLADIFFRPRFKTATDPMSGSPAPGKYPSFIYAPAGAPLSADTYYIVDMDNGGAIEKRGDLTNDWRQTIGSKISGQKLPYAGLFFYFLALAREYLKARQAELGRLGCPLPRVLKEGDVVQGAPAAPAAPGAAPGISTNIVSLFKILGQVKRGIGASMQAELNSNISTYTNKNSAPPTKPGPVPEFIEKYKSYSQYFTPLSASLTNFKLLTDAQKRDMMYRYFNSLYATMNKAPNGERVFYMFLLDLFRAYVRQYKIKGVTTLDQKIDRLFADYNNYILSAPFGATRKTIGQHLEITRDVLRAYAKGAEGDYPKPTNPFTQFNLQV